MRHEAVYEALMARARERGPIDGYVERHHIKPKSLFPELRDDPDNIVLLTAREHFVAHLLLAKMYGGVMSFAAQSMSLHGRYGSREYAWLREESAAFLSEIRQGAGNPMFGRTPSRESVEKRVASMIANRGDKPGPLRGRPISQIHRDRIIAYRQQHGSYWTGRKQSPETVERMRVNMTERMKNPEVRRHLSDINMGKVVPDDIRSRISSALKGRPKPPRSEDHQRNLSEANRRNGEIARARNREKPRISGSMRQVFTALSGEDILSCSDISQRGNLSMSGIADALKKMDALGWVTVTWKRPATTRTGRGSGRSERRFYSMTSAGISAFSEANP